MTCGEVEYSLTFAVDESELLASSPVNFIPWERVHRYPLDGRLGGFQRVSGRCREENLFPVPGIELRFLGCTARRPATELSRLFSVTYCGM
jgi:hypothetical protein